MSEHAHRQAYRHIHFFKEKSKIYSSELGSITILYFIHMYIHVSLNLEQVFNSKKLLVYFDYFNKIHIST
jgi:hypothetical protein